MAVAFDMQQKPSWPTSQIPIFTAAAAAAASIKKCCFAPGCCCYRWARSSSTGCYKRDVILFLLISPQLMGELVPFFARNMFKEGMNDPENYSDLASFAKNL